jgi:hypothetical protein
MFGPQNHRGDLMNRIVKGLAVALISLSAACDGPQEQAGERADAATGAVNSEDSIESGPAETFGERMDEASESAADAVEARADALEDQAAAERDAAEQRAALLEQQAKDVRGR